MAEENIALINNGDTSLDKVWAHYKDPKKHKLTPNQKLVNERWLAAWTALTKHKNKTKVAVILQKAYPIKRAQAFRDIRNAEKLYGNVLRADLDGQRALLYQFALEGFKKAMAKDDLKSAKGFHDALQNCLPNEEAANFNPEKLEYKKVVISAPQLVIDRIVARGKSGVGDYNKIVDAEAIVIKDEE